MLFMKMKRLVDFSIISLITVLIVATLVGCSKIEKARSFSETDDPASTEVEAQVDSSQVEPSAPDAEDPEQTGSDN